MKKLLVLALLSVTFPASAQSFGELFPVTNTRYPPAFGAPRLSTNGRDFFLFWSAEGKTRATKLQDGEARGGHVVLDHGLSDVAWTGQQFLAVSSRFINAVTFRIISRRLDGEGRPVGPELPIVEGGTSPQIAVAANSVLVTYSSVTASETRAILLGSDGAPVGSGSRIIGPGNSTHALASNSDGFLAVMSGGEGIQAVALDRNGQTTGGNSVPLARTFRYVDVASDGFNYGVVWCDDSEVAVATVTENGTFSTPLVIDNSAMNLGLLRARVPTIVWNGAGWTVSYEASGSSTTSRVRIVQLDRSAQKVLSREQSAIGIGNPTMAALDGRIIAAWRPNGQSSGAAVIELPLAQHEPQSASYSAAHQTLLATATSASATLIVWSEKIEGGMSLHTGVRSPDGNWTERQVMTSPAPDFSVLAASDGQQFAMAVTRNGGSSVFRLDAGGRPLTAPAFWASSPSAMAWNGTNYALVNSHSGVLVNPSGQLSAPVTFVSEFNLTTLVSDGNGFFAAGEVVDCPFILCSTVGLRGMRLGPDLKRIDTHDLVFVDWQDTAMIGADWNGSEYVLMWRGEEGTKLARISPTDDLPIEISTIADSPVRGESMLVTSDGSIVFAGRTYEFGGHAISRVAFLSSDGSIRSASAIESAANLSVGPRLALLPDGSVAYLASSVQSGAPHDGTSRIMAAIAKPSLAPPPDAPHVSARLQNGSIVIDWTAPAGTVNGYRLEYRVDDDSWNEYEQWFPPSWQRKTIRQPSFGTQFAFRVRAFNDGGASEYSAVAVTKPSRRRAVR